jgi:hypothetical protein
MDMTFSKSIMDRKSEFWGGLQQNLEIESGVVENEVVTGPQPAVHRFT